jgi:hypothetical protein
MDPLKPILIACIGVLVSSLLTAITLAWQNRRSRNLALAAATLGGVTLFFLTQLGFELHPTTTTEFILTEFGIDRAKPQIRQWVYSTGSSDWRSSAEVNASDWLAAHNPTAFSERREKTTHDFVLFSLAYFLQTPEAQYWEVRKHSLVGKYTGGVVRYRPASGRRECAVVTSEELRNRLSLSENLFAGAPLFDQSICLPPSSVLEITGNSLIIRNHVCEVTFTLEPSGGVGFSSPLNREDVSKLPNGESRFETRTTGLDVEIRFFALRTGQRDSDEYRQWSSALVNGARNWFEK